MAFPPGNLPTNRANSTPQVNTHPADHNQANAAINDIVGEVQRITTEMISFSGSVTAGLPQSFPNGVRCFYGLTSDGWPFNAVVISVRPPNALYMSQVIFPAGGAKPQYRVGNTATNTWDVGFGGFA